MESLCSRGVSLDLAAGTSRYKKKKKKKEQRHVRSVGGSKALTVSTCLIKSMTILVR